MVEIHTRLVEREDKSKKNGTSNRCPQRPAACMCSCVCYVCIFFICVHLFFSLLVFVSPYLYSFQTNIT
ncbi:hypothetical protein DsansV1_C19g0158151 [Dioscorea sansibarensis]